MKITLARQPLPAVPSQWLCIGLFDDDTQTLDDFTGTGIEESLQRLIKDKDLTASLAELTPFYNVPKTSAANLLVVGLGSRAKFDGGAVNTVGYAIAKRLSGKSRESVAVAAPRIDDAALIASVIQSAVAGTRGPGLKKTEADRHAFVLSHTSHSARASDWQGKNPREPDRKSRDRRPRDQPRARPGQYAAGREAADGTGRATAWSRKTRGSR